MARQYRLSAPRKIVNALMRVALWTGVAPTHTYLLTVNGRRTGKRYSTPVRLVEDGEARWLVAPYGERAWVKNARAAGEVELRRGRHTEVDRIEPASPAEAAPVLKSYVQRVGVTRPFFDARPDDPVERFEAEAPRHPVFRLRRIR